MRHIRSENAMRRTAPGCQSVRTFRRIEFELLDPKVEIQNPGWKNLAQEAPRLADAEFRRLLFLHVPRLKVRLIS